MPQEIRRKTRRRFSAEEMIRIVLEGLRGEESIASPCLRERIAFGADGRTLFVTREKLPTPRFRLDWRGPRG